MIWTSLENAFSLIRNGASIKQDDNHLGIPITRIETISNRDIDKNKLGYANIQSEQYSDFYLKEGDILMSHINSLSHLGKTALVKNIDNKIIHGMNLLLLRPNRNVLDPSFANYYFGSSLFINDLIKISNQSVNQCSFSISKLRDLQIPLPSLPIQKRIAEILDAADALKRKDQQLLKKYDELAQAIFIDMFGDPVKNEKGWESIKLQDICLKITDGTHLSPKFVDVGIPFLFVSNIVNYKINYTAKTFIGIDEYETLSKRTPIEVGNILLTTVGSYGNPAMILSTVPFAFQRHIAFIKPNHELINYKFLYGYLKSPVAKYQMDRFVNGVAQKTLNLSDLKNLQIWNAPRKLQDKYADILDLLELQLDTCIVNNSENLFNSLIQKAFKGELAP